MMMRQVTIVVYADLSEAKYAGLLAQNTNDSLTIVPGEQTKPTQACIGEPTVVPWDIVVSAYVTVNGERLVRPESGS
jgi:hypothetical protein